MASFPKQPSSGQTDHALLDTPSLVWAPSHHTGAPNGVATFNAFGEAVVIAPTAPNQVLQFVGGVLVFAAIAASIGPFGTPGWRWDSGLNSPPIPNVVTFSTSGAWV